MNEKILRDWDNADQYLKDNLNNVGSNLNCIVSDVEHIKGTAGGQFVYDSQTKMTKVVPDGVNKGIVAMIGGKTVKSKNILNIDALPDLHTEYGLLNNVDIQPRPDGSLSLTGASNGSGSWSFYKTIPESTTLLKPEHTYTIVCYSSKSVQFGGRLYKGATTQIQTFLPQIQTTGLRTVTFTTIARTDSSGEEVWDRIGIWFRVVSTETYNDDTVWCMILDGESTDTDYEPYFDGLHNAPVESITVSNIIAKPNFAVITKYTEIANRTGYMYESLKTGKYNVSITNTGTKTAFAAVFRNNARVDDTYISINSGTTVNVIYDIIDGDDVAIYQGSAVNIDFVKANVVSVGGKPFVKEISLSNLLDLPDYGCSAGDVYNYIDFEEMVYHHKVRSIDLGTLLWITRSSDGLTYDSDYTSSDRKAASVSSIANIISDIYTTTSRDSVLSNNNQISIAATKAICIYDNTIDYSAARPIDKFIGHVVNYELETEELIDISDILMPFMLESGGTITFENEHNLDVPNTVIYEKEMI